MTSRHDGYVAMISSRRLTSSTLQGPESESMKVSTRKVIHGAKSDQLASRCILADSQILSPHGCPPVVSATTTAIAPLTRLADFPNAREDGSGGTPMFFNSCTAALGVGNRQSESSLNLLVLVNICSMVMSRPRRVE